MIQRFCSIHDPHFRHHERFWKFVGVQCLNAFNGTPFKPFIRRCPGVRMGKRMGKREFDDGCSIPEKHWSPCATTPT